MNTREAYYDRIAPLHMAPLWTRLKALVPAEPTPVGVPHRWAYAELRAHVLEAAEHISAKEAERRVLILENPGLTRQLADQQLALRRPAADHARRGGAGAPAHAERAALHRRRQRRLHGGRGREDADAAGRLRHHAELGLAPPWPRRRSRQGSRWSGSTASTSRSRPSSTAPSVKTTMPTRPPSRARPATRWRATARACCRWATATPRSTRRSSTIPTSARARPCTH